MTIAPESAMTPALSLKRISKNYGGLEVLSEVSFVVPQGSIFGLAGPNGAGKTTLLNIVSGFDVANSGSKSVMGHDATKMDALSLSKVGVARTFQNIRLFKGLTVREQVNAGAYRHRQASIIAGMIGLRSQRTDNNVTQGMTEEALAFVGLSDSADLLAETLSYGDQRRVEISRAMATKPSLLLLDEPTAGMNEADWMPIADLLQRLRRQGTTIVVIEHNMRLIERICDEIVVIAAGAVIAQDEPQKCLRLPQVRLAYFGKSS
jgi:branched-chain amino acid transport system ATP-binding protein